LPHTVQSPQQSVVLSIICGRKLCCSIMSYSTAIKRQSNVSADVFVSANKSDCKSAQQKFCQLIQKNVSRQLADTNRFIEMTATGSANLLARHVNQQNFCQTSLLEPNVGKQTGHCELCRSNYLNSKS